jgi:hypothetical protein
MSVIRYRLEPKKKVVRRMRMNAVLFFRKIKKIHADVRETRSNTIRVGRGRKTKDEKKIPADNNKAKKRKGYVNKF